MELGEEMISKALSLVDVRKQFGQTKIINGVNLDIVRAGKLRAVADGINLQ